MPRTAQTPTRAALARPLPLFESVITRDRRRAGKLGVLCQACLSEDIAIKAIHAVPTNEETLRSQRTRQFNLLPIFKLWGVGPLRLRASCCPAKLCTRAGLSGRSANFFRHSACPIDCLFMADHDPMLIA